MVWLALAVEAIVLFAAAVVAVKWVHRPTGSTPAALGEQAPVVEPTGGMVEQPA